MSEIVKNDNSTRWARLLELARNAKDEQSIMDVVGQIREMPDDHAAATDLADGVSLMPQFNQDRYAAKVGEALIQNYLELKQANKENPFDGKFFDTLFNEVSSKDGVPQLIIGLGAQLDSFKAAMKDVRENCNEEGATRISATDLFEVFDSYLTKSERAIPEVSDVLNQFFKAYQDITQQYFEEAIQDIPLVMGPYEQFGKILSPDVQRKISEQILQTAERCKDMAATHIYYNPNYAGLLDGREINKEQFTTEVADFDMRWLGAGDIAYMALSKAVQMNDYILPEHKQQALKGFAFAIEYGEKEGIRLNQIDFQKWQKILDNELKKTPKIGQDDGLDVLSYDG